MCIDIHPISVHLKVCITFVWNKIRYQINNFDKQIGIHTSFVQINIIVMRKEYLYFITESELWEKSEKK